MLSSDKRNHEEVDFSDLFYKLHLLPKERERERERVRVEDNSLLIDTLSLGDTLPFQFVQVFQLLSLHLSLSQLLSF